MPPSPVHHGTYRVSIGSQTVELPLVPVGGGAAISLLMTIDRGVGFNQRAGADLAELLAPFRPDIVVANATLGIPVAIEDSRALGLDDYLILQKTPKIHLGDALVEPLRSVTTGTGQHLLLDRARTHAVRGRRVVLVDDVIASGSSIRAALRLLAAAGAEVVGVGVLLTEGAPWPEITPDPPGTDQSGAGKAVPVQPVPVRSLGRIPGFAAEDGGYREVWG